MNVGDLVLSAGGYTGIIIGPGSIAGMSTMLVYYTGYGAALSFVSQITLLKELDKN